MKKNHDQEQKAICCSPAATIPFSVHPHTSIRLTTVRAGYKGSRRKWNAVLAREMQKARKA